MFRPHRAISRLLALTLILALLCLSGCGQKKQSPTVPDTTTAPVNPTISTDPAPPTDSDTPTTPDTPTGPIHFPSYHHLHDYLVANGAVTVKEPVYTFTMRAEGGQLLLEYKDETTSVTITLRNGTTTHPVGITFDGYTASAEVDATTYCDTDRDLNNFRCNNSTFAPSLKSMATTAVWTCFTQTAKAMEPSGVTMASLGFANFEE